MRLWTYQQPGFSICHGKVDLKKSRYYTTLEHAPAAYHELAKLVGTDQIVWCYVSQDEFIPLSSDRRVPWTLELPESEFLAVTNTFVWNRMLKMKALPGSLHDKWVLDAPDDDIDRYLEQQEANYHAQQEPSGGWASQLLINDPFREGATVLLRHPIPIACVLKHPDVVRKRRAE